MPLNLFIRKITHRNQQRFGLKYNQYSPIDPIVRGLSNRTWSKTRTCWHIPQTRNAFNELAQQLNLRFRVETKHISDIEINLKLFDKNSTPKICTLETDTETNKLYISHHYHTELWNDIKQLTNTFWLKQQKQWQVQPDERNTKNIQLIAQKYGFTIKHTTRPTLLERQPNKTMQQFVRAMQMRNYSTNSIEAYLPPIEGFVAFFGEEKIPELPLPALHEYVEKTIREQNLSHTQTRHLISAIKFYYEKMAGRPKIYFKLRKKQTTTAHVQSFDILNTILEPIENQSHQLLLFLHLELNMAFKNIAHLKLDHAKALLQKISKPNTLNKFKQLLTAHYNKQKPEHYLFEHNAKPIPEKAIKQIYENLAERYPVAAYFKTQITKQISGTTLAEITKKNYQSSLLYFFGYYKWINPKHITNQQINNYIFHLRNHRQASTSHINNQINALKLYYIEILKRTEIDFGTFVRPKREKKLPTVLSPQEVQRMIAVTENLKHRSMIAMLYASGLRRSELLNLKITDIDFSRQIINVRKGKGKKDRQTTLAKSIIPLLYDYMKQYQPKVYLFEGATGGQYSTSSLAKIVSKAVSAAQINKSVTIHTLRHSFATHLLENSTDIRYIQELLGHNSIKTTEIYTHVAIDKRKQIQSPLDYLNFTDDNLEKPP